MAYTATLTVDFGPHTPLLADVRLSVDGQTISTGIASIPNTGGSGFVATVATLTDGFRGPFVFYDDADPTKYAVGSVGPEHEQLDAKITTRSVFDHTADEVTTDAASRTASQADISGLPSAADIAAAVWSATTRTLTAAALTAADVWSFATRTITSGGITIADVETAITNKEPIDANVTQVTSTAVTDVTDFHGAGGGGTVTAANIAAIADAVWDEPAGDHVATGTTGAKLGSGSGGGSGDITSVNGIAVTSPDDFKADAAAIAAQLVAANTSLNITSPLSTTGDLTITTHTTLEFSITGTIPANYASILFTIKALTCESDDNATLQAVYVAATGGVAHLVRINGAGAANAAWATLTVDQGAGTVGVKLDDQATALLAEGDLIYDIKWIDANSESAIMARGSVDLVKPVTLTI